MLDKLDLNQKIKKKRYKQIMPLLKDRLFNVQKASWDAQLPVVILFEGWDAAGKGTSIQMLTNPHITKELPGCVTEYICC